VLALWAVATADRGTALATLKPRPIRSQ